MPVSGVRPCLHPQPKLLPYMLHHATNNAGSGSGNSASRPFEIVSPAGLGLKRLPLDQSLIIKPFRDRKTALAEICIEIGDRGNGRQTGHARADVANDGFAGRRIAAGEGRNRMAAGVLRRWVRRRRDGRVRLRLRPRPWSPRVRGLSAGPPATGRRDRPAPSWAAASVSRTLGTRRPCSSSSPASGIFRSALRRPDRGAARFRRNSPACGCRAR